MRPVLPSFTLHFAGHATYPPGATFGPRTLRDYEFVWVLQGDVVWETQGERITAGPGTVLLARPGMRDRFQWDPARTTRHGFVHFTFTPEGIPGLADPEAWPLARVCASDDTLLPVLDQLIAVVESGLPERALLVQSALAHALLGFVTGASGTHHALLDALPEAVDRSLRFAQKRWAQQGLRGPSLAELARAGGVSEGHLNRQYHQAFGCGPAEVLRIARLERAAQMLVHSNLGVAEVAQLTGFLDPFHFSRAFKATYRQSPRALRTAVRAGGRMPMTKLMRARYVTRLLLDAGTRPTR